MKNNYLLPHKFKLIGLILLAPTLVLAAMFLFNDFEFEFLELSVFSLANTPLFGDADLFVTLSNNITNELIAVLSIVSLLFIAFSKQKNEDELVNAIRLKSLVMATYINYFILLFCVIFFYELAFLWVMLLNMFTILIFFIVYFNLRMFQLNRK
ncbi:MAG: hypothetical protein CL853_09465 [Crocinitomicaceae bacterium]|nr:hypothetical protein [Crocinitomicaceae bacterium]|tara:strand:- start:44 stop:505 length:462 start_codon:yes stop_codon:yes gene_type:complete